MRRFSADTRFVALSILVASAILGAALAAGATPFVIEVADGTNFTGYYTSMALDAQDRPHISYWESTGNNLRYATKAGGVWTAVNVDTTGAVGTYTSIALDAAGNPRIAYRDVTNGDLKYAARNGGVWTTEVVENGTLSGSYNTLALDANGNPRIAFFDGATADLKYAQKNGGVWTVELVDGSATAAGYYASMALDHLGRPHISYLDNSTDDLRYAFKNGGLWTSEIVDPNGVASWTSIAVDDGNNPRIAYYDSSPGDLRYAAKSAGAWSIEVVDATGNVGFYCSVKLNGAGLPRIAYSANVTDSDLKYAVRSTSTWTVETVEATGDLGYYTSLVLDSQSNPRISYLDFSSGDLRLADSAIHVLSPSGGENWPVGALRDVAWSGSGTVSILLSADGGLTEQTLVESVDSGPVTVRVPHFPSRFARVEVRRSSPLSASYSDTLFTIQTSIALLSFAAAPPAGAQAGVSLSWATDPGPQDLAGYEVERAMSEGAWRSVAPLTRETSFRDPEGVAGSHYRLTAVNGLGERYVLGELVVAPQSTLAAWPLPYRGGTLNVSFATASGLGGGHAQGRLALYDIAGRLVRTIASGDFPAGRQVSVWDGRDESGRSVANGIYFLRSLSMGQGASLKVAVAR